MQWEVVIPTSLTSFMPHFNVQQNVSKPWYFTLLPGISLTALLICLVDVLARVTMTFAASRNTLDPLLFTTAPKCATVPLAVAADKLQKIARCDGVC